MDLRCVRPCSPRLWASDSWVNTPPKHRESVEEGWRETLCAALVEVCANDVYGYLGYHTQRLLLTDLPWLPSAAEFVTDLPPSHGVHVMTEWIDGFSPFTKALIAHWQLKQPIAGAVDLTGSVPTAAGPVTIPHSWSE